MTAHTKVSSTVSEDRKSRNYDKFHVPTISQVCDSIDELPNVRCNNVVLFNINIAPFVIDKSIPKPSESTHLFTKTTQKSATIHIVMLPPPFSAKTACPTSLTCGLNLAFPNTPYQGLFHKATRVPCSQKGVSVFEAIGEEQNAGCRIDGVVLLRWRCFEEKLGSYDQPWIGEGG
jgi:hypothetical protein